MTLAFLSCRGRFRLKVTVSEHDEATLRQMLEYIYTNRVKDMLGLSADEVIKLLALANGESERLGLLMLGVPPLVRRCKDRLGIGMNFWRCVILPAWVLPLLARHGKNRLGIGTSFWP